MSTPVGQPTIILVHGSWGGAARWAGVIAELGSAGESASLASRPAEVVDLIVEAAAGLSGPCWYSPRW